MVKTRSAKKQVEAFEEKTDSSSSTDHEAILEQKNPWGYQIDLPDDLRKEGFTKSQQPYNVISKFILSCGPSKYDTSWSCIGMLLFVKDQIFGKNNHTKDKLIELVYLCFL